MYRIGCMKKRKDFPIYKDGLQMELPNYVSRYLGFSSKIWCP